MAELVLLVTLVAVVLYAVFGGADFGAGIIEPLLPRAYRSKIDAALLPVWEANHVWLVIAAVVCFVAFPPFFSVIATYLHIPILFLLLGIVARGSAFTFRHYDPASTEQSAHYAWYSWVFSFGSLLAPLFLGVMAAALVQGELPDPSAPPSGSFYTLFVAPWNTPLCWLAGVFTCALFAFEGSALLAAEYGREDTRLPLLGLTRRLHFVAIGAGFCVLVLLWLQPWARSFFTRPLSLGALLAATLLVPLVAWSFGHGKVWTLRIATGAQVAAVLVGCFGAHYPVLVRFSSGRTLELTEVSAPRATLYTLLIALGVGLALIGPALVYLLKVFKGTPAAR
ncbi:MAG: cytochrome d ubiquinol oxidase subunit II [Myxococcales bacterium]